MVTLTAAELQGFLAQRWGSRKRSVLRQTHTKLKWFFTWCVKFVQFKGMPPFLNPCDLIEIRQAEPPKRPDFISQDKMMEFLSSIKEESDWLIIAILMTAGLRISELIGDAQAGKPGVTPADISERMLTIREPKSGRELEHAVIPSQIEERLRVYSRKVPPGQQIFPVSYTFANRMLRRYAKKAGLDISLHYLRKWVASYWQRLGEYSMTNFILRHSSTKAGDNILVTSLGSRYIAPLTYEEVCAKQDMHMRWVR